MNKQKAIKLALEALDNSRTESLLYYNYDLAKEYEKASEVLKEEIKTIEDKLKNTQVRVFQDEFTELMNLLEEKTDLKWFSHYRYLKPTKWSPFKRACADYQQDHYYVLFKPEIDWNTRAYGNYKELTFQEIKQILEEN